MKEKKQFHPLLGAFKERMKIFHDAEDANLSRMLTSSEKAIIDLTDSFDTSDSRVEELILERSRYLYNDQVEFFFANFQGEILELSLNNYQ
nr:MAG TPA: Head Tail Connector Protein [Caudoviricetes sp.]